ncbi:MAG TPA: glycoside hydrolase family 16 protein [Chthonomonadaceae bacterium]|nr:glycoside hydrolase family 16 protein [Chthonomonadaceae bacterium]
MQRYGILGIVIAALLVGSRSVQAAKAPATTLRFSGYVWNIRQAGTGGPGPNQWDPANVWVDSAGQLHLKIADNGGQWTCAELWTQKRLGFGRYQFDVIGRIDQFDPNVVLGLFNYPTPDVGPDGTNEIDIEFAQWGNSQAPNGNYTVWPAQTGLTPPSNSYTFNFTLTTSKTTQRSTRQSTQISFQSLSGFQSGNTGQYASWVFAPSDYLQRIPQQAEPVHINLWLFQGHAPTNGQEVEIIIKRFTFKPLTG